MKHISLKGTFHPNNSERKQIEVRVLEQTHRNVGFTHTHSENFYHEGSKVNLYSCGSPEFRKYKDSIELYLQGDYKPADESSVFMSLKDWERVKAAISAYNEKYA